MWQEATAATSISSGSTAGRIRHRRRHHVGRGGAGDDRAAVEAYLMAPAVAAAGEFAVGAPADLRDVPAHSRRESGSANTPRESASPARAGEKETGVAISAGWASSPRPRAARRPSRPSIVGARLDADRVVGDVAQDPRRRLDDDRAGRDRAFDGAGEPRLLGEDVAGDDPVRALAQRGAADVAVDAAVDLELGVGGEIAADDRLRSR